MPHPIVLLFVSTICICGAINVPNNVVFASYNEEDPSSRNYFLQSSAASFSQKPIQNGNFGNQFSSSQFSQLPQTFLNQPSSTSLPSSNRYPLDFQQFFDQSPAQTQNSIGATLPAPNNQNQNSQAFSGQLNHQSPLGVLFSSAPDVSQFRFSGNGVNYFF